MNIFGKEISRREACLKTGRLAQLCGTRHYTLSQGRANGVRCVDIDCGGLRYTVVPDRFMDISALSWKGCNLAYQSVVGEVSPAYYDKEGDGFLDSFFAGLLTTCGLTWLAGPCEDEGRRLGLHGGVSNIPMYEFSDLSHWDGDEYVMELKGTVIDGRLFSDKLRFTRTIRSTAGQKSVYIFDEVENVALTPSPLTVLYHINVGYPLLDTSGMWRASPAVIDGYDDWSRERSATMRQVFEPSGGFKEENYMLTMETESATSLFYNPALMGGLGLEVSWNASELPYMTLWRQFDGGDYVLAMEPSNCPCLGRDKLRETNRLPMLEPGEVKHFQLCVSVVTEA